VKTKKQAQDAITAMDALKDFNLIINKHESQILIGPTCLNDIQGLCGITIVKKVKYL
jgi:hypothetical protein